VPVKVQLVNHDSGVCWEANYAAPKTNTDPQFKGSSECPMRCDGPQR